MNPLAVLRAMFAHHDRPSLALQPDPALAKARALAVRLERQSREQDALVRDAERTLRARGWIREQEQRS